MATVTVGQLGPMRHSADLDPRLMPAVSTALDEAYGPGYSATLRSGAGNSVTGTQRHTQLPTGGQAGDWVIKDPAGNTLFGQALLPLAQVWTAKYGSIGVNAKAGESGSNFTHLDLVGGLGRPLRKGEGPIWFYDGEPKGFREAALSGAPASSKLAALTQLPEPDPFGVDKLNAAYASAPPLPNLRPAQQAIAANMILASLKVTGSANSGYGANVSGRIGLLPTPPMNIGPSQTHFPNLRPKIPIAPTNIAAAQAMVNAALTGNADAIGTAGKKLLGTAIAGGAPAQAAITDYFKRVGEQSPYGYVMLDRLQRDPSLGSKLPTFMGFNKTVLDGLTNLPPRPLFPGFDPMRDAASVAPLPRAATGNTYPSLPRPQAATGNTYPSLPRPIAATGNTYPSTAYDDYNANAAQSAAARARITPAVHCSRHTQTATPLRRSPIYQMATGNQRSQNAAAPPSPVPFPLIANGFADQARAQVTTLGRCRLPRKFDQRR